MPADEVLFEQNALRRGYISKNDYGDCIQAQRIGAKILKRHLPLREIMVFRGLLSPDQYFRLLNMSYQEETVKQDESVELTLGAILFGEVAVGRGFVTPDQLIECLDVQEKEDLSGSSHRLIGQIMVARGYLTRSQLDELVEITREESIRKIKEKRLQRAKRIVQTRIHKDTTE
jgi:hypothetical protein